MAQYTLNKVLEGGIELDTAGLTGVASSDKFKNDGRTFLVVKNADASPNTVGIVPNNALVSLPGQGQLAKATIAKVVPAGDILIFGPFPPGQWNDGNGDVTVTFSNTTANTAGAFIMPKETDLV